MQTAVKSELVKPRLQSAFENLQLALRVLEFALLNGTVCFLALDRLFQRFDAVCELQIPLSQCLTQQQSEMNPQEPAATTTAVYLAFRAHEEALFDLLGVIAVGNGLELELFFVDLNAIDLSVQD